MLTNTFVHMPTNAIQHLMPLRTETRDLLDDPRMASSRASSIHCSLPDAVADTVGKDLKAAMGPLPDDVSFAARGSSSRAIPVAFAFGDLSEPFSAKPHEHITCNT